MLNKKIENILNTAGDKKIATREAYGTTLAELGETNKDIVVLDCDLQNLPRLQSLARNFRTGFSIWV